MAGLLTNLEHSKGCFSKEPSPCRVVVKISGEKEGMTEDQKICVCLLRKDTHESSKNCVSKRRAKA